MTTTNYFNTLIEPAQDCKAETSIAPVPKGDATTIALLQYRKLVESPYRFDSDVVLFEVYAERHQIRNTTENKRIFLAKGQPCFRSSPLTKQYGWCIHCDAKGKIALVALGTDKYNELKRQNAVKKIKAMRNKRHKE